MKLKKQIILFCLLSVIEIAVINLFCQTVQMKPTRQSSIEAFSQGNYERAYAEFRELLLTYSKDPLYKYYSGVCLVKLSRNPGEATRLLQQAIDGGGEVKSLPSDGLFYLGRAQQMSGKFPEATESYNLYTEKVGKKAAKEMNVPVLIQQCIQKLGQVAETEPNPVETVKNSKADTVMARTIPAIKEPIQKSVENGIDTGVNLPVNYDIILGDAVDFQFKADSVSSILNEQKKEMEKLPVVEKSSLKIKILENEKVAASFQKSADQKYHEAHLLMNSEQDSTINQNESAGLSDNKVVKDTAKDTGKAIAKVPEKLPDTSAPLVKTQVEIFTFFEVLPKPLADPNAKIAIDPEVPEGLIYRIQIAVFRNPVLLTYFKGISPIYGFKIEGTDKTIYYAGLFRKLSDAGKALGAVKNKGFKDAFIVALSGNKRVSSDRAVQQEKEWGLKPFYSINKAIPETKSDTITPTLTFRVEVIRSSKPLNEEVVEAMRKMAGNRGMDIQYLEDGKIAYLIGKFITFETASEYTDLMKRNGYREAQVVAWLGKKEIAIETARQLFDKLK